MRLESLLGLVFRDADGNEYGCIRSLGLEVPCELQAAQLRPFAADESGNFFAEREGAIVFWDHETSELTLLASSEDDFLGGIGPASVVELSPGQVVSAWIDPEFAESSGAIGGSSRLP